MSRLMEEYWDYIEESGGVRGPSPKADADTISRSLSQPRLQPIVAANELLDRQDILLAVDPRAGCEACTVVLESGSPSAAPSSAVYAENMRADRRRCSIDDDRERNTQILKRKPRLWPASLLCPRLSLCL